MSPLALPQSAVLAVAVMTLSKFTSHAAATLITETVTYNASDYSGSVVTNGTSNDPIAPLLVTDAFTPFDPTLGTLNAVTVELSLTFGIDWTDPIQTTSPSIGGSVAVVWDESGPGQQTLFSTGGGNGTGPSASGSLTMSMQRSRTTPGDFAFDLSEFTSPYTLSIVSTSMEVGGSSGATVDYELTSGSLSVIYDYRAVPEPGSYATFVGIGAVGLTLLRRRAGCRVKARLVRSEG